MASVLKLWQQLLDSPMNVRFADLCRVVEAFGFEYRRTTGSHHIYSRPGVPELVNIQDVRGQAKPYQVRQFVRLVGEYNLSIKGEEGVE